MILVFAFLSFGYLRGWLRLRSRSAHAVDPWRAGSFLFGMFLVWVAVDSPLADHDHHLLTIHMIQHLLLMTIAPALILMGEPLLAFRGQRPFVQRLAPMISRPAFCWTASALTLVAWHVPALLTMAQESKVWHSVELSSFLGAGLLFWWPVVQPWPSATTGPQWSTLLYLFLATLPCDVLAGFLVFSDRVAYPVYFSMPRHSGLSVMEDQQFAGALMWTCVTLIYLVPAAIVSTRLLSPRSVYSGGAVQSQLRDDALSSRDSQRWEAI